MTPEQKAKVDEIEKQLLVAAKKGFAGPPHRLYKNCTTLIKILRQREGGVTRPPLDVILEWYGTLPKPARERMSLQQLHTLAKALAKPAEGDGWATAAPPRGKEG